MTDPDDRPEVIQSATDPDVECVRVARSAMGAVAAPPQDTGPGVEAVLPGPCPEGYVPRRRRRPPYELDGKAIRPPR